MVLGLYDRDSRAKSLAEAELKVPVLTALPSISDIEFLEPAESVHQGTRQGFGPRIKRVYGTHGDSIRFYYEVYHRQGGDTLQVVEQVTASNGLKILEASSVSAGAGAVAHMGAVPGDSLSSGRYTLKLMLRSGDGKTTATRAKDFEVRRETFYSSKDLDEAVAILTYIATGSQVGAFAKASEDERKKIWEEFWRDKDPTPGTPRNEYLEEHLRRFRYANEHFGVSITPGWKTDRGRIYILYGEPDEIESYPFEMGKKPSEIWTYYEKGRRFVFVDETGFGDYVLVGS
jgi:GWxTD domain-containing protein